MRYRQCLVPLATVFCSSDCFFRHLSSHPETFIHKSHFTCSIALQTHIKPTKVSKYSTDNCYKTQRGPNAK